MKTNLVGLIGFAMVGKDTAAQHMPDWTRYAFADRLKSDLTAMLADVGCRLENPTHKAMARDLMVEWGRTARKFEPAYWVRRLFDDPNGVTDAIDTGASVVITDVRYPNEAERIMSEGGRLVLITRPRYVPANGEEARSIAHILKLWPEIPTVKNTGTKADLGRAVLEVLDEK